MNWKKLAKRALFPHPAFIWVLWPVAMGLLIYSSVAYESADIVSIVSYVLSFCALMLTSLRVPAIIRWIKRFKRENKYIVRITSDVQLRMNLTLMGTFIFNIIYAGFQLALGLWHHSVWFYAMAGYYLLLAMMRLLLVRYTGTHAPGEQQHVEWQKYRICGVLLLLMTLTLAIFILYFIMKIRIFRHHEITTITMAAYTFTSLTLAIVNAVRYKSYGSPAYSAAKSISLVSAVVSMLTLENAMLTAFGQAESELFQQYMLAATGAAVMIIVHTIAIRMIIISTRQLRAR